MTLMAVLWRSLLNGAESETMLEIASLAHVATLLTKLAGISAATESLLITQPISFCASVLASAKRDVERSNLIQLICILKHVFYIYLKTLFFLNYKKNVRMTH